MITWLCGLRFTLNKGFEEWGIGSAFIKHSNRFLPLAILLVVLFAGCTTHSRRLANFHSAFHSGDIEAAVVESEKLLEKSRKQRELVLLDQSLVKLSEGKPEQSEALLREVRDKFASGPKFSGLKDLSSWVIHEQTKAYQPDDYERLFVPVFLAISNLVQDGDDAFAYSNQIIQLQAEIDSSLQQLQNQLPPEPDTDLKQQTNQLASAKLSDPNQFSTKKIEIPKVALAPYINGILYEQTHRDYDSAARFYNKTVSCNPNFKQGQAALKRAQTGTHSRKGSGVLHLFVAVGQGPRKIEHAEVPTSQAMLIADRILSQLGDHTLPPTIAPIKTARVTVPRNRIKNVLVSVDGKPVGKTETITDLGKIAVQQDRATHNAEVARAVVRRIIKKSAVYAGKDALETVSHSWADMLINIGGVIWEATETADTRCWGLLPEKIQVLRVELPQGRHHIGLKANHGHDVAYANVEIRDGKNTYVYAYFPDQKVVGKVLTSR